MRWLHETLVAKLPIDYLASYCNILRHLWMQVRSDKFMQEFRRPTTSSFSPNLTLPSTTEFTRSAARQSLIQILTFLHFRWFVTSNFLQLTNFQKRSLEDVQFVLVSPTITTGVYKPQIYFNSYIYRFARTDKELFRNLSCIASEASETVELMVDDTDLTVAEMVDVAVDIIVERVRSDPCFDEHFRCGMRLRTLRTVELCSSDGEQVLSSTTGFRCNHVQ